MKVWPAGLHAMNTRPFFRIIRQKNKNGLGTRLCSAVSSTTPSAALFVIKITRKGKGGSGDL